VSKIFISDPDRNQNRGTNCRRFTLLAVGLPPLPKVDPLAKGCRRSPLKGGPPAPFGQWVHLRKERSLRLRHLSGKGESWGR